MSKVITVVITGKNLKTVAGLLSAYKPFTHTITLEKPQTMEGFLQQVEDLYKSKGCIEVSAKVQESI